MKNLLLRLFSLFLIGSSSLGGLVGITYAGDFVSDVAVPLANEGGYGDEQVYTFGIDDEADLRENFKKIFFPDATGENQIRRLLRNIMIGLLVLAIIYTGAQFVLYADQPEEVNKNLLNLLFILIGALLIFLSVWILDTLLNIRNVSGIAGDDPNSLTSKFSGIALLVLGIMKGFAFFLAIVLIAYNGVKMLYATGAEDKFKAAGQGILNVILALLFIKIIDYLYFIAGQSNFSDAASQLIVQVSRVLGWILGVGFVLAIIYAGYLMIVGQGDDDRIGQAKSIIKAVAVVGLVILIFLLVIFQIFGDIVG